MRGGCFAPLRSPTFKKDLRAVLVATLIFGNSLYEIVDATNFTWDGAEANAVALGGHLVTINDASENEYLFDLAGWPQVLGHGLGHWSRSRENPSDPWPSWNAPLRLGSNLRLSGGL